MSLYAQRFNLVSLCQTSISSIQAKTQLSVDLPTQNTPFWICKKTIELAEK